MIAGKFQLRENVGSLVLQGVQNKMSAAATGDLEQNFKVRKACYIELTRMSICLTVVVFTWDACVEAVYI